MWKIPLFKIYSDDSDVEEVTKVIKRGTYWSSGPEIGEFENKIAEYTGAGYALAFGSGTSALHAMLLAYGIKRGDEVIVPSFTFISTVNAALFVGAKPVFADIEDKTFGLDPEDVKEKITKKTKAIIPVHYGGAPCMIRELKEIAEDRGVYLFEDAAESLGARAGGKMAGTFGDAGMLSFCQNKIITTGEGGAVITDSKDIYENLKLIRSHGRLEPCDYFSSNDYMDYVTLGYNFRMSDILAAVGIAQLKKVEDIIDMRRKNAEYLTSRLSGLGELIRPPHVPDDYYHVYQLYSVLAKDRDGLMKYMSSKGIMTKVYFNPVHKTRLYRELLRQEPRLDVTEEVSRNILTLPMYPGLAKEDIDTLVADISGFYGA